MFIAALFTVGESCKLRKCSLATEALNKIVFLYNGVVFKKNKIKYLYRLHHGGILKALR